MFGDIGTSPLYALQATFTEAVTPDRAGVYGVISLVFWAITLIVSVKYVTFIMRADNEGEGGIMALIARVQTVRLGGRWAKMTLIALGIFGASLFYGDGMITPAISVLSAVEGLKVASPALDSFVVEITLAIITVLFLIQRFGTGAVGRLFGPVMVVWFTILAVAGAASVAQHPGILRAVSPTYGVSFLVEHGGVAFAALGSVVLTVTGAEALYADMGHFGRPPIRRAWFVVVFPALILNYMGQGALILRDPQCRRQPVLPAVPALGAAADGRPRDVRDRDRVAGGDLGRVLGHAPGRAARVPAAPDDPAHARARRSARSTCPAVNWGIYVAVVALVIGFGSAEHLASAYGIAVTGTLAIDTVLFFVVVRELWHKPLWLVILGAAAFLTVDLTFFAANLPKVLHGGWFPLLIALVVFVVLTTWQRGREIVTRNRTEEEGPLRAFVEEVHAMDPPPSRPPRTGVFLNANIETTPLALRANLEHNGTVHETS